MNKKITLYFQKDIRSALEREVNHYKEIDDESKSTLFKMVSYNTLNVFYQKYIDDIDGLYNRIKEVYDYSEINENNYKEWKKFLRTNYKYESQTRIVQIESKAYDNLEILRLKLNEKIGVEFPKTYFINFAMLNYIIENKEEILLRELQIWKDPQFN